MAAWRNETFYEDYNTFLAASRHSDRHDGPEPDVTLVGYDPLSPGLQAHYELGEFLGKGAFGSVSEAKLRPEAHAYARRATSEGLERVLPDLEARRRRKPEAAEAETRLKAFPHVTAWLSANTLQHRDPPEFPFAAKALDAANVNFDEFKHEVQMLNFCRHPFVLPILEHFLGATQGSPPIFSPLLDYHYIVTVRCFDDVLHRYKRYTSEEKGVPVALAAKWSSQLLDALASLQSLHVIHRVW